MVKLLPLLLFAATGAQALWLAGYNGEPNGAVYCFVGKGNTPDEAKEEASNVHKAGAVFDDSPCTKILDGGHTPQTRGYWVENRNINYISKDRHWYCEPIFEDDGSSSCDAGDGAPR